MRTPVPPSKNPGSDGAPTRVLPSRYIGHVSPPSPPRQSLSSTDGTTSPTPSRVPWVFAARPGRPARPADPFVAGRAEDPYLGRVRRVQGRDDPRVHGRLPETVDDRRSGSIGPGHGRRGSSAPGRRGAALPAESVRHASRLGALGGLPLGDPRAQDDRPPPLLRRTKDRILHYPRRRGPPPRPHPARTHHRRPLEDPLGVRDPRLRREVRGTPRVRRCPGRQGAHRRPAGEGRRVPRRARRDEGQRVPGPHQALGRQVATPQELQAPADDWNARPPQPELRHLPDSPSRPDGLPSPYRLQPPRAARRQGPAHRAGVAGRGFPHYGEVRSGCVVLHGSLPGPAKRLLRFRLPMRSHVAAVEKVDIRYFSTRSKQGG